MTSEIKNPACREMLYTLKKENHSMEEIKEVLRSNPQIKFVSLVGIDLRGNGTDERIPVEIMLEDIDKFFRLGIQTDGSSVVLHNIATLDDAKVIIFPDMDCNWHVDYNFSHIDSETQLPVGTLRIPSFLIHNNKKVCSRSVLKKAVRRFDKIGTEIINRYASLREEMGIGDKKVVRLHLTSATELEFWVQTPEDKADEEKLSTSQTLKEQYWKRTEGSVRTAMEETLLLLQKYSFEPEMGHKEVGGVRSKITLSGKLTHIMEQLEIDWKYSDALQAADNEHFIKNLVLDVFNSYGLEVTFLAKPVEGVAGSGEHTHIGAVAELDTGEKVNIFSHKDYQNNYMTSLGFASLMGILRNYEIINPFVTSTNDAMNRLKPGFEAPVCIVSSLGQSPVIPSRNRSILIGLIKDNENLMATRFELRSTNAGSNTYLVLAACFQAMIHAIGALCGKYPPEILEKELCKKFGEKGIYLERNREYRSEKNVFDYYTQEERNRLFGIPPETVYENVSALETHKDKISILLEGNVFSSAIIDSYKRSTIDIWVNELRGRIIEDNMELVRNCGKIHEGEISDLDIVNWSRINNLRWELMKDSVDKKSLFTNLRNVIASENYEQASEYQKLMAKKIKYLKELYLSYKKNLF